ncbi:hypothetical protein BU14_0943s0002 [Porphyra umbilicalis]|uniref:RNase H type-1 domain-containing protein n=1 Tax=Porphyra umbilicalis TaxID=2786 RepID=A0A1X6NNU7_PORUM|nr:hypothetical protein BU14_0943s0002 [Porphyra umbilicalis]|eukprot:OSX70033.1 hypothetical protein BU14_0943s0002 [Porphyra umbilicalis]
MDSYTLFFDGSCSPNPVAATPMRPPSAASGLIEVVTAGGILSSRSTNNLTEAAGLLGGLRLALEVVPNPCAARLAVRGDSELIIKAVRRELTLRAPRLKAYLVYAQAAVERFGGLTVKHVPRADNARADGIARAQRGSLSGQPVYRPNLASASTVVVQGRRCGRPTMPCRSFPARAASWTLPFMSPSLGHPRCCRRPRRRGRVGRDMQFAILGRTRLDVTVYVNGPPAAAGEGARRRAPEPVRRWWSLTLSTTCPSRCTCPSRPGLNGLMDGEIQFAAGAPLLSGMPQTYQRHPFWSPT